MERYDIINHLIKVNEYKSYLEIGTQKRINFDLISIDTKVCVDPNPECEVDFKITSDEFFDINTNKFDIIFIDGLHHADFVYRDILNSLDVLNENGCIVIHDVIPSSYEAQVIPLQKASDMGTTPWNGDVWKAWIKLMIDRNDLSIKCVNTDHGCGIIHYSKRPDILDNFNNGYYIYDKELIIKNLNLISTDEFIDIYSSKISNGIDSFKRISSRVFITHVTTDYLETACNLAKSIDRFSKYKLIIYCVNIPESDRTYNSYNAEFRDININIDIDKIDKGIGNFYVNRFDSKVYNILCAKTIAMEMALDEWEEVCYLDSDCIATPIVDELFDWMNLIDDYPIATNGIHEYMIIIKDRQIGNPFEFTWPVPDIKLTLEWPLMSFMEMNESDRGTYRTTGIMLMNRRCRDFINTWKELCYILPKLVNITRYAPYHEETIYNVLSWKKSNVGFPLCYINLGEAMDTVKHFYSDESVEGYFRWSDIDFSKNFYHIPDNKRNVKVLHGEKRSSVANEIIEYISTMR